MLLRLLLNKYILGGLAIVVTVIGLYSWGYIDSKLDEKRKALEIYKATKDRINETPITDTLDDALERLRNNGDIR